MQNPVGLLFKKWQNFTCILVYCFLPLASASVCCLIKMKEPGTLFQFRKGVSIRISTPDREHNGKRDYY